MSGTSLSSPDATRYIKPLHSSTPERKDKSSKRKPKTPPLRILNINCQSIKKKQDRIENIIDSTKPDIIMATETWLDPTITDNQVFPPNYRLWRNDRKSGTGGGVLIAIKNTLLSTDIPELQTDCEIIWAKIQLVGAKTLLICCYYQPKTSDEHSLHEFQESLNRASSPKDSILLIGGDFNLPGWDWKSKVLKPNTPHPAIHHRFADCLDDNALTQLVEEPTRNRNTLDLMITNIPSKVLRLSVIPGISDHEAVFMELDTRPVSHKQQPRLIPLYKNARWDSMREDIKDLYTRISSMVDSGSDIDTIWSTFSSNLKSSIRSHIPHKAAKAKDSSPWISKEIKKLLKKRDRLHKKMKKSNDPTHVKQFKKIKQMAQKKLRQSYWSYIEDMVTPQPTDTTDRSCSKRFWTYIKHKKKDNSTISGLRDKGQLHSDPKSKANILNHQFHSVFTEDPQIDEEQFSQGDYVKSSSNHPKAPDITITRNGVEKLLQSLNPHKSPGPDGISPKILKELSAELAPILTRIFAYSLNTGTIPEDWRKANVSPIYKKGNRYSAENYRPISLTCICCKLLEHIVTSAIMTHGEANNILYPLQHGFRKGRSCETQLLEFTDEVTKNLENGQQTDVLVMDFSRAFDKVSHSLLINKLKHYGIQGRTVRWIQAFLSNRTQSVVLEGETSDPVNVASGVPQGSVLGPALFLYYINDIPDGLHSKTRLFADDTISYLAISNNSDCNTLQTDLDKLSQWEQKWKMSFHPDKCQVLSIHRKKNPIIHDYKLHNHILEHVKSAKYLGCTINENLNWGDHINNICKKATRNLNFVRRNLNIGSTSTKAAAYKSLVRPTIEYASSVWDPYEAGDIAKLEMVQRRGARFVKNRYHNRSSVTEMIDDLQWKSLEARRREARLTLLYKTANDKIALDKSHLQPPKRLTRHMQPHSFQLPLSSTTYRQQSFFPRTIKEWNDLPPAIASVGSVEAFKAQLAKHFI